MELRRALLLFAIVLGLAAIASSIARPPERDNADSPPTRTTDERAPTGERRDPTANGPAATSRTEAVTGGAATLRFRAGARQRTLKLAAGRPATVLVEVDTPGEVTIPTLGLTQPGEPLTAARFDVLVAAPGAHEIVLRPASTNVDATSVGTLKVVAAP